MRYCQHPAVTMRNQLPTLDWKVHGVRDVNRFWSSRRKLKNSCQIDADGGLEVAQGPQKLWDKWCKILHSRPLLPLNFIIETSFFCTIFLMFSAIVQDKRPFYYFWLYCGSDSGTSICWLQRCIKILFLQCNLTWKTEQLTNYTCSLSQYGDENDSEVLVQNFIENWALVQWTLFTSFFAQRRHSVFDKGAPV